MAYAYGLPRFNPDQIRRFVTAIDEAMPAPGRVVVIGGAAAILRYGATNPTTDIDIFSAAPNGLEDAIRAAWEKTKLNVRVEFAGVAQAPYNYEDRLEKVTTPALVRLQIEVPERHDLYLMKIVRAEQRDLVVLQEMHAIRPFDLDTIVQRYASEMSHVVADHDILRQKFLLSLDRVFGRDATDRVRRQLGRGS